VVGQRKGSGATAFRGGDGAPVAEDGVDEFLQLEVGTGEVRCSPKGSDEGGTRELTEGERNGGAKTARRRRSSLTGADTRLRRMRKGVTGCSSTLAREDGSERKGGDDWAPFIGDAVGVGDGRRAVPRDGEEWGRGASAAVRGGDVAGRRPTAALMGGVLVGAA
jgi:hypothetical protein